MHKTLQQLRRCIGAELAKIRTLRAARLAALATVFTGALVAAASAASTSADAALAFGTAPELRAVAFSQVGMIVLGTLPVAHEYGGREVATTLLCVPRRGVLVAGKTLAALMAVTLTAGVTMAVSASARAIVGNRLEVADQVRSSEPRAVVGAVLYLALMGTLAHAIALLLRGMVPAIVTTLTLVVVVPELLGGFADHVRWLPSRAGSALYLWETDEMLPTSGLAPATGALVTLGWIAAIGAAAAWDFVIRDA